MALLLRSAAAAWLFALSLTAILITNVYGLAAGTSRVSQGALVVTVVIALIATRVFELTRRSAALRWASPAQLR